MNMFYDSLLNVTKLRFNFILNFSVRLFYLILHLTKKKKQDKKNINVDAHTPFDQKEASNIFK